MNKYWLNEEPASIDTGQNILRWYRAADKLQIAMPDWTNAAGERRPGKRIVLDLGAFEEDDSFKLFMGRLWATYWFLPEAAEGRPPDSGQTVAAHFCEAAECHTSPLT